MADITDDDVLKLAELSKIYLDKDNLHKFRSELQSIVGYVEQLSSVDVSGLKPTNQVTGLQNVMREDTEHIYASNEELLKNAPDREGNLIKVKRILE